MLGLSISSSYLKSDAFQNETERDRERERERKETKGISDDYLLNIHGDEDEVVVVVGAGGTCTGGGTA